MRSWTDGRAEDRGGRGRKGLRPLRAFRSVPTLLLATLAAAGCGGARSGVERSSVPSGGKVITADVIAASGAKTAWDAVRLTVPNVHLRERRGAAAEIQRRGRASIYLDDQVRVILDHVRVYDLQVLQQVAAADILTIEVLTGLDATTYYGGSSTSGVIIIRTHSTSR